MYQIEKKDINNESTNRIQTILIGNKYDKIEERTITFEEGKSLVDNENYHYMKSHVKKIPIINNH